eukprot:CAMPEP_0197028184 /NCGR_PEP_ID=MMETSP1384-20130603/7932_1 /TAXON_ID=29189 /ORGANISM="Ammonia sp." /LENGTH=203 /DNA_ID=CAMNT_0042457149 /DNA_START=232 /DNA_END=843 /DNA_ORIENTATION=+
MTCYINHLNSNKHPFTFVCSSQQTSICFSAPTKYERDAWLSVLDQLQWEQHPQPHANIKASAPHYQPLEMSKSKSSTATAGAQAHDTDDDDHVDGHQQRDSAVSYVISLTQQGTNNDNNYFYNYYSSNLWRSHSHSAASNASSCTCQNCQGQKFTILGLLNNEYHQTQQSQMVCLDQLQSMRSPRYESLCTQTMTSIPAIQSC